MALFELGIAFSCTDCLFTRQYISNAFKPFYVRWSLPHLAEFLSCAEHWSLNDNACRVNSNTLFFDKGLICTLGIVEMIL